MGKHKISITSFVDVDVVKAQSEEDLFSGLEEDSDEPESYTELPKRHQKQTAAATTSQAEEWGRLRTSSRGSSGGRQRRPSADVQTREDVSEFVDSATKDSGYRRVQENSYDGMREEGAVFGAGDNSNIQRKSNQNNDDDSATTLSQDESTISGDTRSTIEEPQSVKVDLLCSDQTASLVKIVEMSKDVNNFLAEELEVDNFSQDISALKQEVVQNSMEHISNIDVAAMFAQFGADSNNAAQTKELEKAPSDALCDEKESEEKKEDYSLPPPELPPSPPEQRPGPKKASSIASYLSEVAGDEGMEIPYLSCGDILQKPDPPEDSKKPAFLARLLPGSSQTKIKDTSEWCPDVSFPDTVFPHDSFPAAAFAETDAASTASLSLSVLRVKLDDGDMVSVSADTVAKLQNCEWV